MFYDLQSKRISVTPPQDAYSEPYVCPPGGLVNFYRVTPGATHTDPPVKTSVAQVRIEKTDGKFLVLLVPNPKSQSSVYVPPAGHPDDPNYIIRPTVMDNMVALLLDDSIEAHPANSVRVINLSRRPAALKIGQSMSQVAPAQNMVIPYPADTRVWLHVAIFGDQGWQRVIGGPQNFTPDTRIAIFLNDIPPSKNDPNPIGLALKKIIEPVAPPPPVVARR